MKKIKHLHKYLIGIIIGIIIIGSISVYAVEAVIESKEVSYDNKSSHGNFTDVQDSIDELYRRSGILDKEWKDPILNGADPVLGEDMIPVTIADDGTVHYANLYTKWYEYETKRWANAVILTDTGKSKNYETGDKIDEEYIESYFVWIPRYKYKIWDLGKYEKAYTFSDLKDSTETAESEPNALRHINSKAHLIDIVFQTNEKKTTNKEEECAPDPSSGGGSNCHVGDYMTHPAFTLGNVDLNGIWVGKFETGKNANSIMVKPNVYSWRNEQVKTFWNKLYNYKRGLDSHMMKNTEWGAVAYLSHSAYGIGREININNNSEYLTGYSATANTDQSSFLGEEGTTEEKDKNQPWNTATGYLASTTGNITGVYDMSGGAHEYMAAYMDGQTGASGFTTELNDANYTKYFDKYSPSFSITPYNNRILGDATGEMGPFYLYFDKDGGQRYHNAWYADSPYFVNSTSSWFVRGGHYTYGLMAGQFNFYRYTGGLYGYVSSRLVLAVQ